MTQLSVVNNNGNGKIKQEDSENIMLQLERNNAALSHMPCPICSGEAGSIQGGETVPVAITFEGKPVCESCAWKHGPILVKTRDLFYEAIGDRWPTDKQIQALLSWSESISDQVRETRKAKEQIKADKLKHYENRDPNLFVQVDAFVDCGPDPVVNPGNKDIGVMGGTTWELMTGVSEVRVLVRGDVSERDAYRGLKKIMDAVEKKRLLF